jgi:hypothetical protein
MTRMTRFAGLLALAASLLLAAPAAAGGSVTASVTDTPDGPVAGQGATIGVDLKQHGVTPISWERLFFIGTERTSGETVFAEGRPEGPVGHYVIQVTFPSAGQWDWRLQTLDLLLEGDGIYPTIEVAPGAPGQPAPAAPPTVVPSGVDSVLVLGIALLAFLLGALAGTLLRRSAPAVRPLPGGAGSSAH